MESVMKHQFSQIPRAEIQRSSFNRSCGHKTTFDAGYLIPIFIDEALPGDTFRLRHSILARLATPIFPLMDNAYLDVFYFAVPLRLIWEHWQRFCGEQPNPGDSTDFLVPQVESPSGGWPVGSLSDYFGLPTGVENLSVSAFWHRAYNLIWNEWFRDENFQDSIPVPVDDGPDLDSLYSLCRRGKRHDYVTSCLPWPQKGPGVELPLGAAAPIMGTYTVPIAGNGMAMGFTDGSYNVALLRENTTGYPLRGSGNAYGSDIGTSISTFGSNFGTNVSIGVTSDPAKSGIAGTITDPATLYADLSEATAATINSLRQAFQLQKFYERDARGGTRYTEILRSHFGVVSPDGRLQRPEYLGGGSARVVITPVQQTSATDTTSPQGNLAAFGIVVDSGNGFSKSFVEHSVILGLACVRADLTYQQGIDRMFSRRTREDFYWPAFAHLGEQAVLNKEVYAQGTSVDDDVFGYQERYAEYRYKQSKITGLFRSAAFGSLDAWHLSQDFDSLPVLNDVFIQEDPPFDRVIAVPSEPHFLFDSFFDVICARPMPVYSVPGLVDHF